MKKLKCIVLLFLPISLMAQNPQSSAIPDWFKEEIKIRTGTWITSNKAYQGENEPYEAYGMEWKEGIGGVSLVGTLYGILNGERTGSFWEFRTFWHPGDRKVYAYQFGAGGVVGLGEMLPGTVDQIFFNVDGTHTRSGHKASDKGNEHITASFNIDVNGVWTERRSYTWKKVDK